MIIPDNASGRLTMFQLIPSVPMVGSLSVTFENNRRFKGIQIVTVVSSVLGAGQYRIALVNMISSNGNTLWLPSYTNFVGASSWLLYPGITGPGGTSISHAQSILSERFIIRIDNSSAVPGNEVTIQLSAVLLE